MNLILRYLEGRKSAPGVNPKLTQELNQTKKDLNQILNKWKFGEEPISTSEEFLANFEPWINRQLEQQKEWKVFLAKKGVSSLAELASLPTSESDQLKFYRENIQIKERIIDDFKKEEQTWQHTEQDYLSRIEELSKRTDEELNQELIRKTEEWELTEQDYLTRIADHERAMEDKIQEFQTSNGELLKRIEDLSKEVEKKKNWSLFGSSLTSEQKEKLAEYEDLITERDEAIREKQTLEQDLLASNNRLNLKQQEVSNKDKALEKLKREKNQLEVQQQKALKEKNTLITTLNQEIKQHKDKYSKQGKLLDTEQLECKKLEEENEKLQAEINQLKGGTN